MKDSLSIGIKDDILLIKAQGHMVAKHCFALKKFIYPYLEHVDRKIRIIVDLTDCILMDSTFIGFLMGLEARCGAFNPLSVDLFNPPGKCKYALNSLAVLDRLNIQYGDYDHNITTFTLDTRKQESELERLVTIFEAHKALSRIDEKNRQEFKILIEQLEQAINKKKSATTNE